MDQTDLPCWNRLLVDAIFHNQFHLSREIRRIDATDAFLAEVGGFDNGALARASFLRAMPHTESGVRSLFGFGAMHRWTPENDDLPFYAQLHLTVLAASADESLQDEGNFRIRLAQMLGLEPKDYVSSGCLPALWKNAQRWSILRADGMGDTRRLILPDPGNETIIGFSKRLAFPGFHDQNRLAELFTRTGIDASAPLSRLLETLQSNLTGFSDRFREEYVRFSRVIETGQLNAAIETPFWDVLAETTWSRVQQCGRRLRAGCRLEIDPTDPYDPGLWVYCRDAMDRVPEWRRSRQDALDNGLVGWHCHDNGEPGKVVESILKQWKANRYRSWLGDRLGRALQDGCIGFAQDDQGRWFDVPSPPGTRPMWLLLHRDHDWLFDAPRNSGKPISRFHAPLTGSSSWVLFGPIEMNDSLRSWLDRRVFVPVLFAKRLIRPTINVVGTVRRQDGGYLYLPPLVPGFRCEGAQSGIANVVNDNKPLSYHLELYEHCLVLPESAHVGIGHDIIMRVVAFDELGRELAHARYQFSNVSSALSFKSVRTPSNWLESSVRGHLRTFSPSPFSEATEAIDHPTPVKRGIHPLTELKLSPPQPLKMDPRDLDMRWTRTTEVLSAVFARRYAFALGECLEFLASIWGSWRDAWVKLNDLVQNGALRLLHTRHWSSSVLIATHPIVVAHPQQAGVVVRIGGLLSAAMRSVADQSLGQRCNAVASPDGGTAGALEYFLEDDTKLTALRAATNWPLLHADQLPALQLPSFEDLFARSAREDLEGFAEEGKTVWSARLGKFSGDGGAATVLPKLERWRAERQQDLFVIYRKDGAMWNTNCRTWALLAFAAEKGGGFGHFLSDGGVSIEDASLALPTPVSWRTVVAGGGVCFRASDGSRVYPAGISWSPADACRYWLEDFDRSPARPQLRTAARDRYRLLLERERRKKRATR
jgi:hypothetical protein